LARSPPPKQLQKSCADAPSTLTKGMKSPRPKRLRKERVPWEAAVASTLDTAKKAERKAPRTDGDCVYVPSHGRHQMGVNSGVQWDSQTSRLHALPKDNCPWSIGRHVCGDTETSATTLAYPYLCGGSKAGSKSSSKTDNPALDQRVIAPQ
jgi:hypothetical protein